MDAGALARSNRAFAIGVSLNVGFAAIEAVAGFMWDSVALIADAGHNFSDVLGLVAAWGASLLAQRKPTERRTYGFSRATSVAPLVSGMLLLLAMGGVAWEALHRFTDPRPASGMVIIVVAGIGVVVNVATALLFVHGKDSDLNLKAAYLHMLADAAVSLGVVAAGVAILITGHGWLDPAASLLVVVVILFATWELLRESFDAVVDAVPQAIDPREVHAYFEELPGVFDVHDLHIWALSSTETALTVHLVIPDRRPDDRLLYRINVDLRDRYGIGHATVQLERGNVPGLCGQAEGHRVEAP